MFETIAEVENISVARVLVTALQAHGFHPREDGETGLPGMPGITGVKGKFIVEVPNDEARDARLLAESLLADMTQ